MGAFCSVGMGRPRRRCWRGLGVIGFGSGRPAWRALSGCVADGGDQEIDVVAVESGEVVVEAEGGVVGEAGARRRVFSSPLE